MTEGRDTGLKRQDADDALGLLDSAEDAGPPGSAPRETDRHRGGSTPDRLESVPGSRVARRRARKQQRTRRGAGDFTSERMLRPQAKPPKKGWRRGLFKLTGGLVNISDEQERRERELIARIKTPLDDPRRIAIISRKGGVGKTTTTLMLGHIFAAFRGDRVIALDGNPDAGSLAYRVHRETSNDIMDLLRAPYDLSRYGDMRAFTNQSRTRLEVLAASDDPRITDALGEDDYRRVAKVLQMHYTITCMDTGTGVLESATRGILELADQIIVVLGPSLDSARTAASTLDWLEENGHQHLVKDAVAVVNQLGRSSNEASRIEEHFLNRSGLVEIDRIEAHFRMRCRQVLRIPWDPALDAGAEAEPDDLRAGTQQAYLELAAAVADGF